MEKIIYYPLKGGSVVERDGSEYEATHIKVRLYYSKGGENLVTFRNEKRGWYVSFTPVKRSEYFESVILGSGAKECILPCNRYGKRNEADALRMFNAEYILGGLKVLFPDSVGNIDMENATVKTT